MWIATRPAWLVGVRVPGAADTLGPVLETVFTGILVLVTIAAGLMALLVVLRLFKGQA